MKFGQRIDIILEDKNILYYRLQDKDILNKEYTRDEIIALIIKLLTPKTPSKPDPEYKNPLDDMDDEFKNESTSDFFRIFIIAKNMGELWFWIHRDSGKPSRIAYWNPKYHIYNRIKGRHTPRLKLRKTLILDKNWLNKYFINLEQKLFKTIKYLTTP